MGGVGVSEGMCTLQAVTVWWFRHLVAWRQFVRASRGLFIIKIHAHTHTHTLT
jgi:hypothetical protein